MDGWETRRRREPGHDWCIVRLGLPGIVHGVVVDTKWFRGNYPESCALDGCALAGPLDLAWLDVADWFPLFGRAALQGDSANRFAIGLARRVTHVRLNIFPDGGVARLRVHGEVVPDWPRILELGGPIDLAALEHGGRVLEASDMFFGNRGNLIRPGRPVDMSDGWETKRRRGAGHDWATVRLGAPGAVERVEIDTTHFKGNAPGRCTLEGLAGDDWRPLLASPLQPHTRHHFADELRRVGTVTQVRLSVFPDGGVARLRVLGHPELPDLHDAARAGVERLDGLPRDAAVAAFLAACGARRFAEALADRRPFGELPALLRAAERCWFRLAEADWLEAFAAHPQIGERPKGEGAHARWSEAEQAGARAAAAATQAALGELNRAYVERNGFIYIVCASGRAGEELLAEARARMTRPRAAELRTAAEEQAKITRLRLRRLVLQS
jgi:allantoicase